MRSRRRFILKFISLLCCFEMAFAHRALSQERIEGSIAELHLIDHAPPAYPPLAKMARIQGDVLLEVNIGADGSVNSVKVISGHPILAPAAIDAVKRWRYRPFLLEGKAAQVSTQVKVNFTLPDQEVAKPSASAKEDNLYFMALFAGLAEMEKTWGYIDDSDSGNTVRTDYHHMFVEKDPEITDRLLSQFGDFRVEYLDRRAQVDRYEKLGKEFSILRIHPMQNEGMRLEINISLSYFAHRRGKFLYAFSDWSDVEFRYDCEKQKFVVSNVKLGGI